MQTDTLFAITGSFISLLLMVNAYFTRKTLEKVIEIEVELKENVIRQRYTERQADNNGTLINSNSAEISKIRERIHSLEGGQSQFFQYLKDTDKH